MTSGRTSERVYDALRRRITQRAYRPGTRLDPSELSEEFGSSVTPVRDALHILIGEGLVATGPGEGFYIPHLDEPALQDLYDWTSDLLSAALRRQRRRQPPTEQSLDNADDDAATPTAALFSAIARRSDNREHALAMRWANARLHPLRLVEAQILSDLDLELTEMMSAFAIDDITKLRKLLTNYHARRKRSAGRILRAFYTEDDKISPI
ncbi:GntR family transcriptional regulator [Sphingobium yanoikuyae]|uniref:HTH gntR-type domain-containing protein n=3 Tax=Sphingobium yanoikuyae TaxID=13690 RepID=K9D0H1_SPHYA|nr:GntR family transcriptional regulator [Sphingobium yanoikuyae]EKU72452.1 hypothetical protein HMPREF9718_04978 [Sphingobium yanoikuyae ATCC 51230]QHD69562.1 GntR family transcriptional regulator [Sphingobium yanoikuyae]WQE09986.1 GntR family transcriptional regulator [Sphingobium yanoikuyae]